MIDKTEALRRYNNGEKLREIGLFFGVSKQRIWQVVKSSEGITREHRKCFNNTLVENLRPDEKYVFDKFFSLGIKVETTGYNEVFDLLIKKKRVQIKFMSNCDKDGFFRFHGIKECGYIDFYVFLCGPLEKCNAFIVDSKDINGQSCLSISAIPRYKKSYRFHKKNKNRWNKIAT